MQPHPPAFADSLNLPCCCPLPPSVPHCLAHSCPPWLPPLLPATDARCLFPPFIPLEWAKRARQGLGQGYGGGVRGGVLGGMSPDFTAWNFETAAHAYSHTCGHGGHQICRAVPQLSVQVQMARAVHHLHHLRVMPQPAMMEVRRGCVMLHQHKTEQWCPRVVPPVPRPVLVTTCHQNPCLMPMTRAQAPRPKKRNVGLPCNRPSRPAPKDKCRRTGKRVSGSWITLGNNGDGGCARAGSRVTESIDSQ